jgi:hypothetical protein
VAKIASWILIAVLIDFVSVGAEEAPQKGYAQPVIAVRVGHSRPYLDFSLALLFLKKLYEQGAGDLGSVEREPQRGILLQVHWVLPDPGAPVDLQLETKVFNARC